MREWLNESIGDKKQQLCRCFQRKLTAAYATAVNCRWKWTTINCRGGYFDIFGVLENNFWS